MRILIICTLLAGTLAAQGPENVLVVVNENSEASRTVGAYYVQRRQIPPRNVCRIEVTEDEEIERWIYENQIEEPVGQCLRENRLSDQILFIVTTLGVPLKIAGTGGHEGRAASVDSELTLLYGRLNGETYDLEGPLPNPFFGRRDTPFAHPDFPIYLVTRLAAYSVGGAKAIVDRSLEARNRGTVILDLSSSSDGPGNDWLRTAGILLPKDRVRIEESEEVLYDQTDVIGYASWGSNDPNRKRRRLGFRWLPGAIATTYVSTNARTFKRPPEEWTFGTWEDESGWFAGSPQSLTADLISEGATGASGQVYEPYLTMTPRPEYLFPEYLSGRTLAESYYAAIPALSWMNIVVGDPLCRLAAESTSSAPAR